MHIYYFNPDKLNIEHIRVADEEKESSKLRSSKSGNIKAGSNLLLPIKIGGKLGFGNQRDKKTEKVYSSGTLGEKARKVYTYLKEENHFFHLESSNQFPQVLEGQLIYFKNCCKAKLLGKSFYDKYGELFEKDMIDWESKFDEKKVVFTTSKKHIIGKSTTRQALDKSLVFEVFGICLKIGGKKLTISPIVITNSLRNDG